MDAHLIGIDVAQLLLRKNAHAQKQPSVKGPNPPRNRPSVQLETAAESR